MTSKTGARTMMHNDWSTMDCVAEGPDLCISHRDHERGDWDGRLEHVTITTIVKMGM